MTRCFNSYVEALDFEAIMRDRYETKVIKVDDYWMVVCER